MYVETFPLAVRVIFELPLLMSGTLAAVVAITVAVPKLPTFALPTTLAVPGIFAPVDVTTNCAVALPPMNVLTLPAEVIVMFDVLF